MNKSESINELATALAKAQSEMKGATKSKSNPFFKSTYADLSCVLDACREALTKNGLSISQMPEVCEDGISLTTMMLHSSGQWISSEFRMPVTKKDPQAFGSALTYSRRYALAAIVGIAQEDDDANSASGLTSAPTNVINLSQQKEITDICEQINVDITKFCAHMAIPSIDALPVSKFKEAMNKLAVKAKKANESATQ